MAVWLAAPLVAPPPVADAGSPLEGMITPHPVFAGYLGRIAFADYIDGKLTIGQTPPLDLPTTEESAQDLV